MTLEIVHRYEKLAPQSGVEFRPMALISGTCLTGPNCARTLPDKIKKVNRT